MPVIDFITSLKTRLTYFALHKLLYLIEYESVRSSGKRLTSAYFIRQKDGAYCTDLHPQKLKSYFSDLQLLKRGNQLYVQRMPVNLFASSFGDKQDKLTEDSRKLIIKTIEKYGDYTNGELKTKTYMTSPMREILRQEKHYNKNMFNIPINFFVP